MTTMDDDDEDEEEEEEEVEMDDYDAAGDDLSSTTPRVVADVSKSTRKSLLRRRAELRRYVTRLASSEFGERGGKVMEIDVVDDLSSSSSSSSSSKENVNDDASVSALVRLICSTSARGPSWVSDAPRPYLVTDGVVGDDSPPSSSSSYSYSSSCPRPGVVRGVRYDPSSMELMLTGYIRGNAPLDVNRPMHVPHLGTFHVKDVRLAGVRDGGTTMSLLPPIVAAGRRSRTGRGRDGGAVDARADGCGDDEGPGMLLASSNVDVRESLDMFASPDALEGEQNLIGFDEDGDRDDDDDAPGDGGRRAGGGGNVEGGKSFRPGTSRPAGWSDYQSAWLDALDGNDEEEDHGELAFALNRKSDNNKDGADTVMGDDDDEDGGVNAEERRALLAQRRKAAKGDLQFPDEVEYEEETSARDRYAPYSIFVFMFTMQIMQMKLMCFI